MKREGTVEIIGGNYPTITASWAAEEKKREAVFLRNRRSGVVQPLRSLLSFMAVHRGKKVRWASKQGGR